MPLWPLADRQLHGMARAERGRIQGKEGRLRGSQFRHCREIKQKPAVTPLPPATLHSSEIKIGVFGTWRARLGLSHHIAGCDKTAFLLEPKTSFQVKIMQQVSANMEMRGLARLKAAVTFIFTHYFTKPRIAGKHCLMPHRFDDTDPARY